MLLSDKCSGGKVTGSVDFPRLLGGVATVFSRRFCLYGSLQRVEMSLGVFDEAVVRFLAESPSVSAAFGPRQVPGVWEAQTVPRC